MDLENPSQFQEKHENFIPIASNLLFELSVDSSLNEAMERQLEEEMNQKKRSLTHGHMCWIKINICKKIIKQAGAELG